MSSASSTAALNDTRHARQRRALSTAARKRFVAAREPEFCALRGYHGPFCNEERYQSCPGWEGMGECLACGGTVRVESAPAE